MTNNEIILTREGLDKIERELENLKKVKRKEIAARIKQAISFGDISENSEYEDAKNEQAFVEGRIATLEKWLRNARLVDRGDKGKRKGNEPISLGDTVRILDKDNDEVFEYTIVGTAEADPGGNKISNESPVGGAILGQKAGSILEVAVPSGVFNIEILNIV